MIAWKPSTEGTFRDLGAETYHAAPGVSNSMLRAMDPTPAHLRAYLEEEFEPTPLMILGTLTHSLIQQPELPLPKLSIKPADMRFSTKEGKAWKAEQEARGCIILGEDAHDSLLGIVRAVSTHNKASELLQACETELSIFVGYEEEDASTLRKGRMDIVPHSNILADLKTCDDASPESFSKKLADGYAMQAAYYLDLWNDANPRDKRDGFVFIAVERRRPYCVATYLLDEEAIRWGRAEWQRRIRLFMVCESSGIWPGYPTEYVPLGLPRWAMRTAAL